MTVQHIKLNDGWIITEDGFIVHLVKGEVYKLNHVGKKILQLIMEGKSENEICDIISKEYSVDSKRVKSEFRKFITSLEDIGIVEVEKDE